MPRLRSSISTDGRITTGYVKSKSMHSKSLTHETKKDPLIFNMTICSVASPKNEYPATPNRADTSEQPRKVSETMRSKSSGCCIDPSIGRTRKWIKKRKPTAPKARAKPSTDPKATMPLSSPSWSSSR